MTGEYQAFQCEWPCCVNATSGNTNYCSAHAWWDQYDDEE